MATKLITNMGGCHMNYKVKSQTHMITSIWGSTFAIPLCSQVKDLSSAELKVLTESLTLDRFIEQQLVKLRFQSRVQSIPLCSTTVSAGWLNPAVADSMLMIPQRLKEESILPNKPLAKG